LAGDRSARFAGDDAILIVCPDKKSAARLAARIQSYWMMAANSKPRCWARPVLFRLESPVARAHPRVDSPLLFRRM